MRRLAINVQTNIVTMITTIIIVGEKKWLRKTSMTNAHGILGGDARNAKIIEKLLTGVFIGRFNHLRAVFGLGRTTSEDGAECGRRPLSDGPTGPNPPRGFANVTRINNLRKSMIWDNAIVQTTILVFRETDSSTTSSKRKKSQIKHVNIGPSMFPFLYYPSTVLAARSLSKQPSHHNTRGARNSSENKLKDQKNMKSPRNSTLWNKSIEETRRGISRSTSHIAVPNYVIENGTENVTTDMENKVTSTMINFSHIKLAKTVSQDACTQVFITCNNAVSGSTMISKDNDDDFYYGIDRGTEVIPPLNKSQRSISIMTSKGIIQELTDKDTQVFTVPSIRKISMSVLVQEHYKDAKSSVVTDTTVPCRKFENIMVTSKGTILSCTGTKVTSVSSAQIQAASETSRISRGNTVNTGTVGLIKSEKSTSCALKTFADTATNTCILTLQNTDCLTSPSLYRNHREDICLGTEAMQSVTSEKSTSCALKTFADAGNSASDLVDRASYNNGSHHTLISFVTGIHPVCTSACMNTDLELNDKSTKTGLSFDKRFEKANKSTRDVYAQYSGPFNRSSNDTWDQSNSRCLANIGRSRLMAVRTLINSVTEMATQVEPVFHCAETNTTFKPKKSTSVLTSRYSIDRSNSTLQAHPLRSNSKVHPEEGVLTCHCTKNECVCKRIDVDERNFQVLSPVPSDVACKTVLSLTTQTEPKVSPADSNTEPNAVISSKLNATKWMKGYIKESVKDVESIISISETMVAESLDRASLVIALSQDRKSISEMKKLSKVLINHQPAISCVTASGYNPSSSGSVTKLLPIKDKTITQEEQTHMNKQNETDVMIFNQMKSDENTTNDIKQHMSQLHPNLCDTVSNGTGYHATPSASINKVLPTKDKSIIEEQNLPIKTQNRNDLVMVNQMTSDENTTKHIKEPIPQLRPNLRDTGTDCDVKTSKQQSASVLTSRHILASPPRCSNTRDDISGDCIFVYDRPRCVVHSFFTDAKAQTDVHHRNSDITCKKPGSISNRSIGLATSFAHHLPCSRQKSYIGGDVLSPQVYKALYETTKLIAKNGSATTTPKISAVQATTKKTDNEDAIRDPRTQSNGVSPMPACLLSAPAHCCCARCLNAGNITSRSIQTLKKPLLCCPHCNARISRSYYGNSESMKNISIQAVADSFLDCPQCSAKIALLSNDSHHESTEKCMESYLVASCRYYSNLLTIKLGQVKENFIKHLALPIEDASHHATVTFPDNISHCTVSNNNIILTEACTMKPSGKQDENCEAKFLKQKFNQHSCILFPALSLTDVRGNDKNDLKNVYCILTAIEGRVRRLRNNLTY
ncbi:uncharacterized protein LOC120626030 [Pararge aegeria]|uniref:uncharacterized protein LOC120626030 n=1 Tax=Pararge aegeria TaxID=116150 RepID=UPI0019CF5335|nr:uncharacterized protein LOC120626030 [Pararge aegeria]